MSTRANDDGRTDGREPRDEPDEMDEPHGPPTIESYETEDGVVFYDAENPLAWMETSRTLRLEELA